MSILGVLRQDAFDLSGIVGCFITHDLDWHGCDLGLDGGLGEGAVR